MNERHLATVLTAIAVVLLMPSSAQSQTQTAAADTWTPPRTPDGQPDLQGIWNNSTLTPLERPEELADKEFLTEEEAAGLEQETIDRNERLANRPAERTTAADNVDARADGTPGFYNNLWLDRGTAVVPTRRTSLIVDPPNGRLPPLTPAAHQRVTSAESHRLADVRRGRLSAASWEELDLSDRCIWYRGIPSLPTGYNNNYHIVQTPEHVAILQEHIHEVRIIPLDGAHVAPTIRQYAGDSRGHWEGDTLVVETTNFSNKAIIRGFNGDLNEALQVVERFTRVAADQLDYQFTVDDPKTWTSPWQGSVPMTRSEGPIFEYACHEGNYGLYNILAGSRAEEKATGAKQGSR